MTHLRSQSLPDACMYVHTVCAQVLPDPDAGLAPPDGRQPVRPGRHGKDRVGQGLGGAAWSFRSGVQLRRIVRLLGYGQAVRGAVPGRMRLVGATFILRDGVLLWRPVGVGVGVGVVVLVVLLLLLHLVRDNLEPQALAWALAMANHEPVTPQLLMLLLFSLFRVRVYANSNQGGVLKSTNCVTGYHRGALNCWCWCAWCNLYCESTTQFICGVLAYSDPRARAPVTPIFKPQASFLYSITTVCLFVPARPFQQKR